MSPTTANNSTARLLGATATVVLGALLAATYFQTCLTSRLLASNFISPTTWFAWGHTSQKSGLLTGHLDSVNVLFLSTFLPCLCASFVTWFGGAGWLVWRQGMSWREALICWGWYGWVWWCLIDVWEWLWIAAGGTGWAGLASLLSVTPQVWLSGCLAGWMTTWLTLAASPVTAGQESKRSPRGWLWLACGIYVVVFTTMNWRLYFNLLIPHGDSAMYEEHLWNLLHGKGFRSYLDQGLFFGEHIQFVHLFLLPLYVLWPSHLLLEVCSTTALACGAFPVYWMVRRQLNSDRAALAVAIAYLLYFPMQFLDIEIDLKTFRPESFGIPLLLLTLDQLDRKNLVGTLIGIGSCLTVKEDYAIIFGPLGVWIALSRPQDASHSPIGQRFPISDFRSRLIFGLLLSVFSVAYLWLATRFIMPWFRSGVEVHYASYFAKFGHSPEEIVRTMLTNPGQVVDSVFTIETALFAIALLAPLAFLPLLAVDRLLVGLPLFGILCLNELENSRTPQHQFHAPLVAIIFWSLAAALPRAVAIGKRVAARMGWAVIAGSQTDFLVLRNLVWTSALATGLFFSLSPLGITFWDSGSSWYWRRLYGSTHRAAMFARIAKSIPLSARVASTDFVHPRFTHYDRSYDYSDYQRRVSGEGNRIPDDTDYVVIDTDHRYSKIKQPNEVPEWRDHPDRWELLPDETEGYFIVLKRKKQR